MQEVRSCLILAAHWPYWQWDQACLLGTFCQRNSTHRLLQFVYTTRHLDPWPILPCGKVHRGTGHTGWIADSLKCNLKTFLFPKLYTCHVFCSMLLSHPPQVSAAHFKLCKFSFVLSECSCVHVPLCVCVHVYVLSIVSMDKSLHFTNTSIIIIKQANWCSGTSRQRNETDG